MSVQVTTEVAEDSPLLSPQSQKRSCCSPRRVLSRICSTDVFVSMISFCSTLPAFLLAVGAFANPGDVYLTCLGVVAAVNMGAAPISDAVLATSKLCRGKEETSGFLTDQEDEEEEVEIFGERRTGYAVWGPGLDALNQFPPFALLLQHARAYNFSNPVGWVGLLSYIGDVACLILHDLTERRLDGTIAAIVGTILGVGLVAAAPWVNAATVGAVGAQAFVVGIVVVSAILGLSGATTLAKMLFTRQRDGVTVARPVMDWNANVQSLILAWKGGSPASVIVPFAIPAIVDVFMLLTLWILHRAQAPRSNEILSDFETLSSRIEDLGFSVAWSEMRLKKVEHRDYFNALSTFHAKAPRFLNIFSKLALRLPSWVARTPPPEENTLYVHVRPAYLEILMTDPSTNMVPMVFMAERGVIDRVFRLSGTL